MPRPQFEELGQGSIHSIGTLRARDVARVLRTLEDGERTQAGFARQTTEDEAFALVQDKEAYREMPARAFRKLFRESRRNAV
jgi:hypothetical protein